VLLQNGIYLYLCLYVYWVHMFHLLCHSLVHVIYSGVSGQYFHAIHLVSWPSIPIYLRVTKIFLT